MKTHSGDKYNIYRYLGEELVVQDLQYCKILVHFDWSLPSSWNQRPLWPWSEDQQHFGRKDQRAGGLKKVAKVEIYLTFAFFAFHSQRTKSDFKDWGWKIQYIAKKAISVVLVFMVVMSWLVTAIVQSLALFNREAHLFFVLESSLWIQLLIQQWSERCFPFLIFFLWWTSSWLDSIWLIAISRSFAFVKCCLIYGESRGGHCMEGSVFRGRDIPLWFTDQTDSQKSNLPWAP